MVVEEGAIRHFVRCAVDYDVWSGEGEEAFR